MSYNNNQYGGARQGSGAPKREVVNEWRAIGILRSRYGKDDDEIKMTPYPNGGGVVHATLVVTSDTGVVDPGTGAPKMRTLYKLVDISTNKLINQQQLLSLKTGMKIRIAASLVSESYVSKKDNQRHTQEVAKVFALEILEMPQAQQGFQQGAGYPAPQGGYPQQQGGYAPQPGMYPPPQQGMYPLQQGGGYPAPQGGYPQQGGYAPQPGMYPPPQQGMYPPQQGGGYAPSQPQGGGAYTPPPQQGVQPQNRGNVRPAPAYTPTQAPVQQGQHGQAAPPASLEDMPEEYMQNINV